VCPDPPKRATGHGKLFFAISLCAIIASFLLVPMSLRFFLESAPGDNPAQGPLRGAQSLSFSVFLGGEGYELGEAIAVDSAGNCYLTGMISWSSDFPLLNASQSDFGGELDVFVAKLSPDGELIFSTFLGGSNLEEAWGIAVDDASNCYVTGYTNSSDFPLQNPLKSTKKKDYDAFVTKFNATGGVVFSTFLGGEGGDGAWDIAVDTAENCYIVGSTSSNDFPTLNAFQSELPGLNAGFVTKLNATGTGLIFSTFLGGSRYDDAEAIALDSVGNCYIAGDTDSDDFPLIHAYQSSLGSLWTRDGFVAKLNATGNGLLFSTYLGGDGLDHPRGIAVDNLGNSYVTGITESISFPVINAYQSSHPGRLNFREAFVTKLSATGTNLLFSTFLGGGDIDGARDIAVDENGNSYVTGRTSSEDFPVVNSYQSSINRAEGFHPGDAFVTKINATGNGLMFSTFLGGNDSDTGRGIAVDKNGNCFVTGQTESPNFPANSTFHRPFGGSSDVFVAKLQLSSFNNSSGPRSLLPLTKTKETGLDIALISFMMGFGCLSIFRNIRRRNRINSEKIF
jgi:hypothetical protein